MGSRPGPHSARSGNSRHQGLAFFRSSALAGPLSPIQHNSSILVRTTLRKLYLPQPPKTPFILLIRHDYQLNNSPESWYNAAHNVMIYAWLHEDDRKKIVTGIPDHGYLVILNASSGAVVKSGPYQL
jgi:hypothetical protein